MASDLLSLKWNNHNSTFFHLLLKLCLKELHSDATIACQGKYFPAHKLVLSSCSKYFEEIFEKTECKHPFIIINDLDPLEFEALMQYMYKGEVNVPQNRLPALIKAAEALNIKGLAIPDEIPNSSHGTDFNKKRRKFSDLSPSSKRKKMALHNKSVEVERPQSENAVFNPFADEGTSEPETLLHTSELQDSESNELKLNLVENSSIFSDQAGQIDIKSEPEEKVCLDESQVQLNGADDSALNPKSYSCPEGLAPPHPSYAEPHADPLQLLTSIQPSDIGYTPADDIQRGQPVGNNLGVLKKYFPGERRTFRCHYCSYLSFNRTHTINHMRRHTGEKPFTCSLCMKRFSLKHNLDRHIKSHKQDFAAGTAGSKPLPEGVAYAE